MQSEKPENRIETRPTPEELLVILDRADALVAKCFNGGLKFREFVAEYDDPWNTHALDGHESDAQGRAVLEHHADRIAVHRTISERILARLCSEQDAGRAAYIEAGRFGAVEGLRQLRALMTAADRTS